MSQSTRRLAAIMFTDMVGYSAVAFRDEARARKLVAEQRTIVRQCLNKHHGVERQTTGDGFFIEFASAVDAVHCATEIQSQLNDYNRRIAEEYQLKIRIGIHLGDIVSSGEDLYGNGVNLAARLEPLAEPGGLCISQQVFDQVRDKVSGVQFRRLGHRRLKNIASGADLYHSVFPWQNNPSIFNVPRFRRMLKNFSSLNSLVITGLFVACATLLTVVVVKGIAPLSQGGSGSGRLPASQFGDNTVSLETGWQYQTDPSGPWREFDPVRSWKYANEIQGDYRLQKTFTKVPALTEPAIVLGLISDSHRVYLNGHFIGGSDQYGDLAFYPFDPRFLTVEGENKIEIRAHTRPTLNPGLALLPGVGAFLGDMKDVRQAVLHNELRFHILNNIYFVLTLLTFLACFGFASFYRRSVAYFYGALILLFGTIHLAYYSPWTYAAFDYPTLRFLKLAGLALTPFVLFSAFLGERQKERAEVFNNALAGALLTSVFFVCSLWTGAPLEFSGFYNQVLTLASAYTLIYLGYVAYHFHSGSREARLFAVGYFLSGFVSLTSLLTAIKMSSKVRILPPSLFSFFVDLSLAQPFLLSVVLIFTAAMKYALQRKAFEHKRRRDDLILALIELLHSPRDSKETLGECLERTANFLEARRASLYRYEEGRLELLHVKGQIESAFTASPMLDPKLGVIGYALETRHPLLIQDIRTDSRFFGSSAPNPISGHASYRNGSCMIFPLLLGEQIVGILAYSDRRVDEPFVQDDFALGLVVASNLTMFLESRGIRLGQRAAA